MSRLFDEYASSGVQIVQHDTNYIERGPVALLVTAAGGTIRILTIGGDTLTMSVPSAGWITPFLVNRVYDTGTTVADADMIGIRLP